MPFVSRDPDGYVIALHQDPLNEEAEELPLSHPDIVAFLHTQDGAAQALADLVQSDQEMARVVEDLVDLLISRGVIDMADFPPAAQEKLLRRRNWRGELDDVTALFGDIKVI